MRWDREHRSDNVDDRRGQGGGGGGGLGIIFLLFRQFGVAGGVIGLLVVGAIALLGGSGALGLSGGESDAPAASQVNDEGKAFVSFVLDDIQKTWTELFRAQGRSYPPARLVLFSDRTQSACGNGNAATGPFYCPGDQRVYIDLSFYRALRDQLGAPGDFAQAYVIAHEVGHHITNLEKNLGAGRGEGADSGSVRVELQADCYAGVWAHSARERKLLEMGDLEEAMHAAEAIGDDTLQKSGGGAVRPESFTHGTSEQRMRWFKTGYASGNPAACNTLDATSL